MTASQDAAVPRPDPHRPPALQQPPWPGPARLGSVLHKLANLRLDGSQSPDLAFLVGGRYRQRAGRPER